LNYRGYRLSAKDAKKIVKLKDREKMNFTDIGRRFGVSSSTVLYAYRAAKERDEK